MTFLLGVVSGSDSPSWAVPCQEPGQHLRDCRMFSKDEQYRCDNTVTWQHREEKQRLLCIGASVSVVWQLLSVPIAARASLSIVHKTLRAATYNYNVPNRFPREWSPLKSSISIQTTANVFSVVFFFFLHVRSSRVPGAVVAGFPSFIFGVSFNTLFSKPLFNHLFLDQRQMTASGLVCPGCWRPETSAVRQGSRWPAAPGLTLLGIGWAPLLIWDSKEVLFGVTVFINKVVEGDSSNSCFFFFFWF